MKALFAIIVLVFVFWGVGGSGGPTSQVIATVNGERITDTQYQRLMRNISRTQGNASSDAEQSRIAQQAVASLIQTEVLLQEAEASEVEVSADEIARYVLQIDAFKGSDGKFSDKLYERNLKRMGMSLGAFEAQIRDQLTLQKLTEMVWEGVQISPAQVKRQFLTDQIRLSLKFARIPESALIDDVEVNEEMLATFIATSEGEIRARYEADFARLYKRSARATLSQILLKTEGDDVVEDPRSALEGILDQARNGADFGELARTHSQHLSAAEGGDIGTVAEEQLSPALAAAIFDGKAGSITDVITTNEGLLIAKVETLFPAEQTGFEEVKEDIARTVTAEQNVGPAVDAYALTVLNKWQETSGSPDELLAEQGVIAMSTPPFPLGEPNFPGLSDSPALMQALATATGAGVLPTVYPVSGGRIVAEIITYERPSEADFEEKKAQIQARTEARAKEAFVQAWQEDAIGRAKVEQFWQP